MAITFQLLKAERRAQATWCTPHLRARKVVELRGGIVSHCVALRAACGAEPGLEKTLGVATCEELCLSPDCTEGEIKVCLFC